MAVQRQSTAVGKLKLRNLVMPSDLPQWVKETPCHIRQNAIFDTHQAYTESHHAIKKQHINHVSIPHRD